MKTAGGYSYDAISEQVLFRMVRRAIEADWLTDEEIASELRCSRDFVRVVRRALTHQHRKPQLRGHG